MNQRSLSTWSLYALLTLGALIGCSDSRRELSLSVQPPVVESVHNQQKVTVTDNETQSTVELSPDQLAELAATSCGGLYGGGIRERCYIADTARACDTILCMNHVGMCEAKTLLALAHPQAQTINLGTYVNADNQTVPKYSIPSQGSAARAALAYYSWKQLGSSAAGLATVIRVMYGEIEPPENPGSNPVLTSSACQNADPLALYHGHSRIADLTSSYAEVYHLLNDAADLLTHEMVNVGDSGGTARQLVDSDPVRACDPLELSRHGAAQFLMGGRDLFPDSASPPPTICADSNLDPNATAALAVLREAAPNPLVLMNDGPSTAGGLPTLTLLDGNGNSVIGGSVRQRLGELYPLGELASGQSITEFYRLDEQAFTRARAYMIDEIRTFARSNSQTFERRGPGGVALNYPAYTATGTAPRALNAAYYTATMRSPANRLDLAPFLSDPPEFDDILQNRLGWCSHADAVDVILSNAAHFMVLPISDQTAKHDALMPLSLLLASGELTGRVQVNGSVVSVFGYLPDDKLLVVSGEDQLRCATTGTNEGGNCSVSGTVLNSGFATSIKTGLTGVAYGSLPNGAQGQRAYVLRPVRNITQPGPGDYEALTGFNFSADGRTHAALNSSTTEIAFRVPIVPRIQERVGKLLSPSRKSCEHPQFDCGGTNLDERMPLENELSDDQDGVESSWRHYLALARSAADLADSLGTDYVNSGLDKSRRTEETKELDLRQEERHERADEALQRLRDVCGADVSIDSIQELLSASGQCGSSTCKFDIEAIANSHPNDPNIQRIRNCLSIDTLEPYVSAGTEPLCFWYTNKGLCEPSEPIPCGPGAPGCPEAMKKCELLANPSPGGPKGYCTAPPGYCPTPLVGDTCTGLYSPDLVSLPPGAQVGTTVPLGYFDTPKTESPPWFAAKGPSTQLLKYTRCQAIAAAGTSNADLYQFLGQAITANNFLHPLNLAELGTRLNWEGRYGGYSAILVDGNPKWETGSAFGSNRGTQSAPLPPTSPGWPCAVDPGSVGMFSRSWDCTHDATRAQANDAMLKAVLAAWAVGREGMTGSDPSVNGRPSAVAMRELKSAPAAVLSSDPANSVLVPSEVIKFWHDNVPFRRYPIKGSANQNADYTVYDRPDDCSNDKDACKGWFGENVGSADGVYRDRIRFAPVSVNLSGVDYRAVFDEGTPMSPMKILMEKMQKGSIGSWQHTAVSLYTLGYPDGQDLLGKKYHVYSSFTKNYYDASIVNLTADDLKTGLELMCAITEAPPEVDLAAPPQIRYVDDLAPAARYIARLAEMIRLRSSLPIFVNMPKKVEDALRSESAIGAFPQYGGEFGKEISVMRTALLGLREVGPQLASEVKQLAVELENLHSYLHKVAIRGEIDDLQFASTMSERLADCARGLTSAASLDYVAMAGNGAAATIGCVNSIAQINFAEGIRDLQRQDTNIDGEVAIGEFSKAFNTHATNLQTYSLKVLEGFDDLESGLASIESLRRQAGEALTKALYLNSYQAVNQAEVTNVIGDLYLGKQVRYERALSNARLMTHLAKRAIEERLGMRLSTMTDPLPLVEPPSQWENKICTLEGLKYDNLTSANQNGAAQNFAGSFIGDYVIKLENVVESYRLAKNFHEGIDTAVVSLKNDLLNVRVDCEAPGPNLLYHSGDLTPYGAPGWELRGCKPGLAGSGLAFAPDCGIVTSLGVRPSRFIGSSTSETVTEEGTSRNVSTAQGYQLAFGSGASDANTVLVQDVLLIPGHYRFSWYTEEPAGVGGAAVGVVRGAGVTTASPSFLAATQAGEWNRLGVEFDVPSEETVTVGFKNLNGLSPVTVAATMLERLPSVPYSTGFTPYSNTTDTLNIEQPVCEDQAGDVFRFKYWTQDCLRLCADGFSSECAGAQSELMCFHQTQFSINQRDLQLGKVMNYSGFAQGNFNYRIESVALNFVGSGIRDCSDQTITTPCYTAGFIPYSLYHEGPFWVRNDQGADFAASLFDGNIEHARGLALERQLSNPLSETDRGLIQDYIRPELQGRPLDGTFVIRVWDSPGVNFEAIQDVQLLLKYRYWTRAH